MSERQFTQDALLVAHYMTRGQYDSEVGTWGYYTKSAFRKFLDTVQIDGVLREHLNSGVYHYVDELPTEVANALLAEGPDEVTTEGTAPQEPEQEPEHNAETETETESETTEDADVATEDADAETAETENAEEPVAEETEDAEEPVAEETESEEKPKARRSRRS